MTDGADSGGGVAAAAEPSPSSAIPFECPFCETAFKSSAAYTAHMQVHETQFQYDYKCATCERRFVCPEELQLHSRLHSDLQPYKCKLCSLPFRLARSLEYHLIAEHSARRLFHCPLCDDTFAQLADIHEHLRDHQLGHIAVGAAAAPAKATARLPTTTTSDDGKVEAAEGEHEKPEAEDMEAEEEEEEEEEDEEDGDDDKYMPVAAAAVLASYPEMELTSHSDGGGGNNGEAACAGGGSGGEHSRLQIATDVGGATAAPSHVAVHVPPPRQPQQQQSLNGGGGKVGEGDNDDGGGDGDGTLDEEAVFNRAVSVKRTFCNLCNKKMATRKSLNTHYKSVHMKNAHVCPVCRTSFLFRRLLEEHTSRRKRVIPCEFCDQRFCSMKRWDSHIARHRADSMGGAGGVGGYPRAVVPLTVASARNQNQPQQQINSTAIAAINLQRHSLLKNNNRSTPSPSNINNNNNTTATTTTTSLLKGTLLLGKGTAQQQLQQQQQSQQPLINLTADEKFPCESCGKVFLSLYFLQSHLEKRRNPRFSFQCDVCEHRFSKKHILDEHKLYHEPEAAPLRMKVAKLMAANGRATTATTMVMNNNTNSNSSHSSRDGGGGGSDEISGMEYNKHIIRLPDAFKCNCCHRTFKAVNHLKCHLRYTHLKKEYKCRSCNTPFPSHKLYLAHMKNSKLCERCDKRICVKFDFRIHTQKCRGTAKMRNSTGNMVVQKSNIVEIEDDEDEDPVIIDENGVCGGNSVVQQLHSSLMLPSGTSITSHSAAALPPTMLDDLMDTSNAADFPPIPHFLMDSLMMDGGGDDEGGGGGGGSGASGEEYKCEACGKTFAKMTSLHMHSFQHDPNKEMKCIFCNFLFLQRSSLNRHYRCRDSLHTCRVCKQAFCSHLNLRQHACSGGGDGEASEYVDSSMIAVGGGGVGGVMGGEEDEFIDLKGAAAVAAAEGARKRNRAGVFISGSGVAGGGGTGSRGVGINSEDVSGRDESIELSDTEPDSLGCMICQQVMNTKAELDHHVATEHGTVTKCPVCFKGFRSPTILHIHMAARASKKNRIECTSCSHRFSKQAEFRKHFMYHTLRESRPNMTDEAIYSRIAQKYPGK